MSTGIGRIGIPETPESESTAIERRFMRLEQAIRDANAPIVTSLPTQPRHGQQIIYKASAALGYYWRLIYDETMAGNYKWVYLGGSELYARTAGEPWNRMISVADGIWQTFPSTDWSQTIPLAGDYMVEFQANFYWRNANSSGYKWCEFEGALRTNGVKDTSDNDGSYLYEVIEQDTDSTSAFYIGNGGDYMTKFKRNAWPANAVITPTWRINNMAAGDGYMISSRCTFKPVRVG